MFTAPVIEATQAQASPVSVTLFGAIPGDGLDDSSAISAALAAHEEVYLPPGIYDVAKTLYIPSRRRLTGAGMDAVTIRLMAGTVVFRVDGQRNVLISGMTLERPTLFQNQREEMVFIYNGSKDVHLHRIRAFNSRSRAPSLLATQSENVAFTECEVSDTQMVIFEENAWQVYGSGITASSCRGVFIEDCSVVENRDMVAEWVAAGGTSSQKYNWYQAGAIQVSGSSHVVVRNNTVRTTGNGIDMGGAAPALVEGNDVDNCHETGIKCVNGANNQIVRNNRVTRCGIVAIWITPGNTNFAIRNCSIENNVIGQIGQGIGGNGYWNNWFNQTVPAGIHFHTALTTSQRSRDHVATGNRFYETSAMRSPGVMIQTGNRGAFNITQSDNSVINDAVTPPLAAPPSSTGYQLPVRVPVNTATFSDSFSGPAGDPGPDYEVRNGSAFTVASGAIENTGTGLNIAVVPSVTLPDAEGYARGERFTAAVDLLVPNNAAASAPAFGLVLNFQNPEN